MRRLHGGFYPSFEEGDGLRTADDLYYNAPKPDIQEIVTQAVPLFSMMRVQYREEVFDCDDYHFGLKFIFSLAGYAKGLRRAPYTFGIVWGLFDGESHAMNWTVTAGHRFWFVEPQTGEMISPNDINYEDIDMMIA